MITQHNPNAGDNKCSFWLPFLIGISTASTIAILIWPEAKNDPKISETVLTRHRLQTLEAQIGQFSLNRLRPPEPTRWAIELQEFWGGPLISPELSMLYFDGWGRPFEYKVALDDAIHHVVLRSRGKNGEDEEGKGDDISISFNIKIREGDDAS